MRGRVFFALDTRFANRFDYRHAPKKAIVNLTDAHFWGTSAVAGLDRVTQKLRKQGVEVEMIGPNLACDRICGPLDAARFTADRCRVRGRARRPHRA